MLKRRQYTSARDVFTRGMQSVRRSIDSERRYLSGLGQLAKYWTVRTVPSDIAASMPVPAGSSAASASAAAAAAQGGVALVKGAPLINPFQLGLPAGSTSPFPAIMMDYRIGTLDISLDRGKTWLYRNDAGELFVDESVGKELETASPAAAAAAAAAASSVKRPKKEEEADEKMQDGAAAPAASPAAPIPSWLAVSQRLHRAQHYLLYKHLYSALMHEARELRIASHKEQQKAASASHNSHAAVNSAGGAPSASAAAAAASTPAGAAASISASFLPPAATHVARPWSVSEVSTRRIRVDVLGFAEGFALEWTEGVHQPFRVRTSRLDEPALASDASEDAADPEQLPLHLSRLLCNQCMSILLEQTQKNSLGNRRTLELLGLDDIGSSSSSAAAGSGANPLRRDLASASTGVGLSGTGQEEAWPSRSQPSMLQLVAMATGHWRIGRQVRSQMRRMQVQRETAGLQPFRVKFARTKQPYLSVFTILLSGRGRCAREVLEARLKGMHLSLVLRLPATAPKAAPSAYAAFGGGQAPVNAAETGKAYAEEDYAVAETVLCSSAQHFADVLARALSWYR